MIVDCCYEHQKCGNSQRSGKKTPSEWKILTKGEWPILKCIALSTKIFCIIDVLAGFFIDNIAT
jgi:hypothetical protein